jgi:aspartyl-tRNA(Asn)/glutamyl-tRNA(Gln) amidotransferase subunit B
LVKEISKWILGDLTALLKEHEATFETTLVKPDHIKELVLLVQSGKLSGKMAKTVLETMVKTGTSPQQVVAERKAEMARPKN